MLKPCPADKMVGNVRNKGAHPITSMVWIYGGALVHGQTSLYPADALAEQGVVVVSMNYRMDRLGFFAHPALFAGTGMVMGPDPLKARLDGHVG